MKTKTLIIGISNAILIFIYIYSRMHSSRVTRDLALYQRRNIESISQPLNI